MCELFQIKETVLHILMPKEVDHHISAQLKEEADNMIKRNVIDKVIFDFRKTEFMDSSGIGLIMGRYKLIQYVSGQVEIIRANKQIEKILDMSGIGKIVAVNGKKGVEK